MPYRFHPEAREELIAAADWYSSCSDLSPEFVAAVESTIKRILQFPRAYACWSGLENVGVRRCVLRRFPFVIVYAIANDEIVILAAAHTSREPCYWTQRLRA